MNLGRGNTIQLITERVNQALGCEPLGTGPERKSFPFSGPGFLLLSKEVIG